MYPLHPLLSILGQILVAVSLLFDKNNLAARVLLFQYIALK